MGLADRDRPVPHRRGSRRSRHARSRRLVLPARPRARSRAGQLGLSARRRERGLLRRHRVRRVDRAHRPAGPRQPPPVVGGNRPPLPVACRTPPLSTPATDPPLRSGSSGGPIRSSPDRPAPDSTAGTAAASFRGKTRRGRRFPWQQIHWQSAAFSGTFPPLPLRPRNAVPATTPPMPDPPSTKHQAPIPESLAGSSTSSAGRLWRIKVAEAVLAGASACSSPTCWSSASTASGTTPPLVRLLILLGGSSAMFAVFAPYWLHRWVFGHRREDQLARLIARASRVSATACSAVVELQDQTESADSLSPRLRSAAMEHVAEEAQRRQLDHALPPSPHRRWSLAVLALFIARRRRAHPHPARRHQLAQRWLMPLSDTPRYTFTRLARPRPLGRALRRGLQPRAHLGRRLRMAARHRHRPLRQSAAGRRRTRRQPVTASSSPASRPPAPSVSKSATPATASPSNPRCGPPSNGSPPPSPTPHTWASNRASPTSAAAVLHAVEGSQVASIRCYPRHPARLAAATIGPARPRPSPPATAAAPADTPSAAPGSRPRPCSDRSHSR